MTSKEFVRERIPKARAEKQVTNGGGVYWLIREGSNAMYFTSGYSESNAWKNAKNKLKEQENAVLHTKQING